MLLKCLKVKTVPTFLLIVIEILTLPKTKVFLESNSSD